MVVAEIIEGKTDGFWAKRFLSAQRSLGGSTEEGGGSEIKTKNGQESDGAKTEEGSDGSDDTDSESSADE